MKAQHEQRLVVKACPARRVRNLTIGLYETDHFTFMKIGNDDKSIMFNTELPEIVLSADDFTNAVEKPVGSRTIFTQEA